MRIYWKIFLGFWLSTYLMVSLAGIPTVVQTGFFTGAPVNLPISMPSAPVFNGLPLNLQMVDVDPITLVVRWSQLASVVGVE